MGNTDHTELITAISSLEMTMYELGLDVELGSGVAAIQKTYLNE
jgi:aspartate aminotransferase-like enzyme